MKVYFYDTETGIYQGEDFEDELPSGGVEGVTSIAPPPYGKGHVPVYDTSAGRWSIRATSDIQPCKMPPD